MRRCGFAGSGEPLYWLDVVGWLDVVEVAGVVACVVFVELAGVVDVLAPVEFVCVWAWQMRWSLRSCVLAYCVEPRDVV